MMTMLQQENHQDLMQESRDIDHDLEFYDIPDQRIIDMIHEATKDAE